MYRGQPDCTEFDLIARDRKSNEVIPETTLANRLRAKALVLE